MASPFVSVECAIRYDNARVITWSMNPKMSYPDNFILQVENARTGGPWSVLASDLKDTCSYIDTRRRNYNKFMDELYRLRIILPDTGEEYVSEVVQAGKFKAFPFSAEAENVIKQAEKAIEDSGCSGVLLKKKHWGQRCPDCTDFDGQNTVNEHCPRCLGTGYIGGYYNGITMWVIKDSIQTSEEQTDDCVEAAETVQGRCIAYPWVRPGDVWCEDHTNKRFRVDKVVPTSSYKHVALIYSIVMHRIEYTDVLYTPIADDKVTVKDVIADSTVEYTPVTETQMEQESYNKWEAGLDEL